MKALTVRQPWAAAIMSVAKTVESKVIDSVASSALARLTAWRKLRKPKGERAYDTGRAEAKKIHAWMIFNLPSSTYEALAQLLREIE